MTTRLNRPTSAPQLFSFMHHRPSLFVLINLNHHRRLYSTTNDEVLLQLQRLATPPTKLKRDSRPWADEVNYINEKEKEKEKEKENLAIEPLNLNEHKKNSANRLDLRGVDENWLRAQLKVVRQSAQLAQIQATPYLIYERLAKRIARSGVASRRNAENFITQGLVQVNGQTVTKAATNVTPLDAITLNNKPLPAIEEPKIWLHYKMRGVIVTNRDPEGRPALIPHLKSQGLPHMLPVGRLDFLSEGLLVLTNNGKISQQLMHPSNCLVRRYRVRIQGSISHQVIEKLKKGITIKGVDYAPMKVEKRVRYGPLPDQTRANEWVVVELLEGKNREIRRVFRHFDLLVTRIVRVSYGPFDLGKLKPGETIEADVSKALLNQAGDQYWHTWNEKQEQRQLAA